MASPLGRGCGASVGAYQNDVLRVKWMSYRCVYYGANMSDDRKLTSENVARNIATARRGLGLSYAELSRRTEAVGHTLPVLALQRIEKRERRIDVDDLTTFATVLNRSVPDLVGPPSDVTEDALECCTKEEILLSGSPPLTRYETAAWLRGDLPTLDVEGRAQFTADEIVRLQKRLDELEEEITDETAYELRGIALHMERDADYLARRLKTLKREV